MMLLAVTTIVIVSTNENLFDLQKLDRTIFNEVPADLASYETNSFLLKWRSEYNHPLMLNSTAGAFSAGGSTNGGQGFKNAED